MKLDLDKITNSNIKILVQAASDLGMTTSLISLDPVKIEYKYKNKSFILGHDLRKLTKNKQAKAISRDKLKTLKALKKANLPIPKFIKIKSAAQYLNLAKTLTFPQVIKPMTSEKGKYVFLNIKSLDQGQSAIKKILKFYPEGCLIEDYVLGQDYRFLVLKNKVIGMVQRLAPTITADGKKTIKALIDQENQKRLKTNLKLKKRMLNRMRKWDRIEWYLNQQNLSLTSIPAKNKKIILYPLPNFSTGGLVKAIDLNQVNPKLKQIAVKAVQTIGLTIGGVDMLIKDIKNPPDNNNAVIIELNSDPGLRLHDWPNQGQPQQTAQQVLKYIFNI